MERGVEREGEIERRGSSEGGESEEGDREGGEIEVDMDGKDKGLE
jgi:hypothetical protein